MRISGCQATCYDQSDFRSTSVAFPFILDLSFLKISSLDGRRGGRDQQMWELAKNANSQARPTERILSGAGKPGFSDSDAQSTSEEHMDRVQCGLGLSQIQTLDPTHATTIFHLCNLGQVI